MSPLRVCLVQADLVWEHPAENRHRMQEWLADEAGKCDLVVLPEMFSTGFSMDPAPLAESSDGPTVAWMQSLATQLDAAVMGSLIIRDGGQHFNRLFVVDASGVQLVYDKRHLFRFAGEQDHYSAGTERPVFSLKGWRICPQICYDLRFPVFARNRFGTDGQADYDLLVYVANWPAVRVSHWNMLLRARAVENQAWVIGVNRVGEDGKGIAYSGDSAVIDHLGRTVVTGQGQPQLLRAELDRAGLEAYREKFQAWRDADDFQLGGVENKA